LLIICPVHFIYSKDSEIHSQRYPTINKDHLFALTWHWSTWPPHKRPEAGSACLDLLLQEETGTQKVIVRFSAEALPLPYEMTVPSTVSVSMVMTSRAVL